MSETIERESQAICGFTAEDYAGVLADLLPLGMVWPRDPDTSLMRTISGLAEEFARVHNRDCDLLMEAYPGTAIETISDWERVCGLPDPCTGPLGILQERREAVLAKLGARGGQSRQYYIDLAAALGFEITITEFRPFLAGESQAGDPCCYQSFGREDAIENRMMDWWFVWRINTPNFRIVFFRASQSQAGDPLARWGNELLECTIAALKPAHTGVIYSYGRGLPRPPHRAYWDTSIGGSFWDGGASVWDGVGYP